MKEKRLLPIFIKNIFVGLITFFCASFLIFILLDNIPGDAASFLLGIQANESNIEVLRNSIGINHGWIINYFFWIKDLCTGQIGTSLIDSSPIADVLYKSSKVSFILASTTLCLSCIISIPAASFSALYPKNFSAKLIVFMSRFGIAIPSFWIALILIKIFILDLHMLPLGENMTSNHNVIDKIKIYLLPIGTLCFTQSCILIALTREIMEEILQTNYIRTAYAKGLSAWFILWKHALPNAIPPLLALLSLQFSFLLSGTVIIENIFHLPGLGRLLLRSIEQRDMILVRNICIIFVATIIILNTLVECLQNIFDPRISMHKKL